MQDFRKSQSAIGAVTGAVGMAGNLVKSGAQTVGSTAVSAGQLVGKTAVGTAKNVVTGGVGAVTGGVGVVGGIAKGAVTGGIGVVTGGVGVVGGIAKGGVGVVGGIAKGGVGVVGGIAKGGVGVVGGIAKGTAMRMTMMNPRLRRGKYSGGRRLKRQNSKLAWESRVTAPYIKIDLVLQCQNLPKKSSFNQADGFCVVWEIPAGHKRADDPDEEDNSKDEANGKKVKVRSKVSKLPARHEKEIGRTEVCRENKNPCFTKTFRLEYKFQEEQHFIVRVYNEDLQYSTDLKEHDFIGGCVFSLGELLGAGGCSIARPIGTSSNSNKNANGPYLILIGQEIVETREVLEFRFSGQDLGSLEKKRSKQVQMARDVLETMQKVNVAKTVLDKFNLYFRIEKLNNDDQSWKVVWKSEVIKDNQDPTWNSARIPLQLLCDDDPETPIKITIWDWNRFSQDELVGSIETTVNELTQKRKRGIPVFNVTIEKKRLLRGPRILKAGIIKALKAQILQIPSMLQYISGGCQMDLIFAIDCTMANGDWRDETSQHYPNSEWLNDYQAAIRKIATVYQGFEGDKDYGLWGYGAIIDDVPVTTYFSMGEKLTDANKLVEAYDKVFSLDNPYKLQMDRKGYLKPIIQAAMYRASQKNLVSQCYATLVVLTTGEISDVVDSIDAVCSAAEDSPLSIVIIGVGGSGDFQLFDLLTGAGDEGGKLRHSNGVPIAREIVNIVSFHDFSGNASQVVVEALREVPEQFVQYFLNAGIQPMPPKALPDFTWLDGVNSNGDNNKLLKNGNSVKNNIKNGKIKNKTGTKKRSKKKSKRNGRDDDSDVSDLEDD